MAVLPSCMRAEPSDHSFSGCPAKESGEQRSHVHAASHGTLREVPLPSSRSTKALRHCWFPHILTLGSIFQFLGRS